MNAANKWKLRLTVLSRLVQAAQKPLGRTALMKLAYLLQTVRNVPLNYHFTLYHYGPYDSDVVSDLAQAVSLKAIASETVMYANGYGYEYKATKALPKLLELSGNQQAIYENDISWVLHEFGSESAAVLELIATIVYASREAQRKETGPTQQQLCRTVKNIKPHFSEGTILQQIERLDQKGLIQFDTVPEHVHQ